MGIISSFADWFFHDILLFIPKFFFSELIDAVIAFVQLLTGLCGLCSTAPAAWASMWATVGPGLVFLATIFALKQGFQLIAGALLVRFILRALPWSF